MGKAYNKIWRIHKQILKDEHNTIYKERGGRIGIVLAYPNTYYVGMSNLGFHTIYFHFNKRADVVCERIFLPDKEQFEIYQTLHIPLATLESGIQAQEFDIIAFSCSFESDYVNILKILELSNIPLRSKDRGDEFPLVIMGGACTFFNPEPIADYIDVFLCGEGENLCNEFLDSFKTTYQNEGKERLFKNCASIKGVYIPKYYKYHFNNQGNIITIENDPIVPDRIMPRIEKDIDKLDAQTRIVSPHTEFGHMHLLEVSRGCPRACNFCILSRAYKPFRIKKIGHLLESAKQGLQYRDKIGLIGASICDYPHLDALCEGIMKAGGRISVSSLRADCISEKLLEYLIESGHQTITLAPEAASEKLRKSIGKDISDEQFFYILAMIIKRRVPKLKLYFMIGLPGETMEDIEGIVSYAKKIRHFSIASGKGKGNFKQITLSLNAFVPKPLTRFQRLPMEDLDSLNYKVKFLRKKIAPLRGITIIFSLPKWSYIQCLLSRGDRRVGHLLYNYHKSGKNWRSAFSNSNINADFYIYRYIKKNELLPWHLWIN
ncbi:MAG: B12-binding domain-containing radical SAM protein [bacterium]